MKIAAIIAEYNPLHEGHIYHMEQTRQRTGADFVVTILSGDFVQRGLPAIEEKFVRVRKALEAGSDLVLELPLPYALSSAEGFAFGGVSLANQLGCVDYLSFGLEDEKNLDAMELLAREMNLQDLNDGNANTEKSGADFSLHDEDTDLSTGCENDSLNFHNIIKNKVKEGFSYPDSVAQAAAAAFPVIETGFLSEKGNSNSILALEYLRALEHLGSSITPVAVARLGASYLSEYIPGHSYSVPSGSDSIDYTETSVYYPSATALRAKLRETEPSNSPLLFSSDFSALLHYKLLSLSYEDLLQYREMTPQLAHKIMNALPQYKDYEQFANLLWTKNTTYSRVCRQLLYILLDIKKDTWDVYTQVPYARILGFRKSASPLLHQMKESSSIPLISKLADAPYVMSDRAQSLLNLEVRAGQIYDSVRQHKCGERLPGEYQKQIVISS
ncbi:MAG: nucleotidyltransferase family protein [Lachnospiraceae bacterium]|nr:nucleotidyltransferase family protein [Lachnospiraceae bacterium]